MTNYFSTLPPDKLREYQEKSMQDRRSPALKKAWVQANDLKQEYEKGVRVVDIAKKYKITERSAYRIVLGR